MDIASLIFFSGLIVAGIQFYRGYGESRKMGKVVRQCRTEIRSMTR